ncbi:Hypothetical predicted protein [Scomber scombrus]|uniref:Uncharacterized protein n=1 Tax=Scomber scombrus TaxID=13677 RepID=A0AAV1MY75_SCOSC
MSCCSGCLFHELSGVHLSTSTRCPDIKRNSAETDSSINTENIPPSSYGGFVWAYVPITPIMQKRNPHESLINMYLLCTSAKRDTNALKNNFKVKEHAAARLATTEHKEKQTKVQSKNAVNMSVEVVKADGILMRISQIM